MKTEQEILEGNKLIAEFMGATFRNTSQFEEYNTWVHWGNNNLTPTHDCVNLNLVQYHNDWNWLMPVVGKINEHGYNREGMRLLNKIALSAGAAHLLHTYQAVLAFINWYNAQPHP